MFSRQPVVDTFDVSFHLCLPTSAPAQRRSSEAPCQGWQSTSVCLATVSQHPCSQPTAAHNCIFPILHTAPHSLAERRRVHEQAFASCTASSDLRYCGIGRIIVHHAARNSVRVRAQVDVRTTERLLSSCCVGLRRPI